MNLLQQLQNLSELADKMKGYKDVIEESAELLSICINNGGKIYVIGNGGSASDAMHFSGELLGRFKKNRKAIPAVALTSDIATITAIANDMGYENIFRRQLEALFKPEDFLLCMSTSGNSKNVINAIDYVLNEGGGIINLLGKDGGDIGKLLHPNIINIVVPSQDTARIQEMHQFILHYMSEVIEDSYI